MMPIGFKWFIDSISFLIHPSSFQVTQHRLEMLPEYNIRIIVSIVRNNLLHGRVKLKIRHEVAKNYRIKKRSMRKTGSKRNVNRVSWAYQLTRTSQSRDVCSNNNGKYPPECPESREKIHELICILLVISNCIVRVSPSFEPLSHFFDLILGNNNTNKEQKLTVIHCTKKLLVFLGIFDVLILIFL